MRPPDPRETLVELPAPRLARWLAEARRLGANVAHWHLPDEPTADGLAHVRVDLPLPLRLALETDPAATLFESVAPDVWLAVGATVVPDLVASPGVYRLVRADGRVDSFASPGPTEAADCAALRATTPGIASKPSPPLTVIPRLRAHSRAETPGLWVLKGDALPGFTRIVREMDETQMLLWQFAVGSHKGQLRVVLRPAHRRKSLQLFLSDVPAYVAHLPVSQLFLPAGMALRPMPRPDVLRQWVRTRPERIYWFDPHPEGIAVESIPEAAFRPLREWVVWKSTSPLIARVGWTDRSASLRPEGFQTLPTARELPDALSDSVASGLPARPPAPTKPLDIPDTRPRPEGRSWVASLLLLPLLPLIVLIRALRKPRKSVEPEPPEIDMAAAVRTAMGPLADRLERPEVDPAPGRKELQELENTLIQRLDKLTPREFADIWPGLAAGYHRAENHADSAICSLLALWDHPTLQAELTWGWFRSEATQAAWNPRHVDLNRRLQMPATPAMVRALAAYVVQNLREGIVPEALRPHLPTIQTLLEEHEAHLTIRAVWLVRMSLAKVGGGDVLSLARTRDRLIDRLRVEGLRPDRDLPACLGAGASNIERYRQVRSWLGEHRDPIQQWVARQARPGSAPGLASVGLEAETKFTAAYADLILAWGLTRLSDHPAADRLRAHALRTLAVDDPVHSLLRDMWLDRIDRAREQVPETPIAEPLLRRFAGWSQTDRYNVEKWLERSRILEPDENRGAYRSTVARYGRSGLEQSLYALSEERDADRAQAAVRDLLARTAPEQMATAVPLLLDLHGRLGGVFRQEVYPRARALLDDLATPSAVRQAILERGMLAAAACDEPDLVRAFADWLHRYLNTRPGGSLAPYEMLSERLLRCLRRLGMKSEMAAILDGAAKAVLKGYGPSRLAEFHPKETALALRLSVMIAGGWCAAGATDRATPLLDHVRTQWQSTTLSAGDRTRLALEYAGVLGQVPAAQALERMEELFATLGRIQNTGSTNRYYTLKVLEVVESVVLSVVSDEFLLGPMVRGWLDDEEFRIRQRIRADLNAMLVEQGLV